MLTREEIDRPYVEFFEHLNQTSGINYVSLGEISVLVRAKSGWIEELFRRKMLIQDPKRLDHFCLNEEWGKKKGLI